MVYWHDTSKLRLTETAAKAKLHGNHLIVAYPDVDASSVALRSLQVCCLGAQIQCSWITHELRQDIWHAPVSCLKRLLAGYLSMSLTPTGFYFDPMRAFTGQ